MELRFASYNIQFGIGKDGRCDLERIAAELDDADIIALQEVEAFNPSRGLQDQPAELARLLKREHWVFGPGFNLFLSEEETGGRKGLRQAFGNMVLSRWPILSVAVHPLPSTAVVGATYMQKTLIETVIGTPAGPLRVYCTHLDHSAPMTRLPQIARLQEIILTAARRGGPWGGSDATSSGFGLEPPVWPEAAILLGDLNFAPGSPEYEVMAGEVSALNGKRVARADGLFDAWVLSGHEEGEGVTFMHSSLPRLRLDYCFVNRALAESVRTMTIDDSAVGSDHQPIFVTVETDKITK